MTGPLSDPIPDDLFESAAPAAYSEALSDNIDVCTPERELALVRAFAPIGLDPCGNPASTVGARNAWWGPVLRCAICNGPATWGHSIARADRCEKHAAVVVDKKDRPRILRVPDYILEQYGGDGLVRSWADALADGEIVFLQPPYGRRIIAWIPKANAEAAAGAEIIGLLPGRFDTRWFRAMRPSRICWYGRRIPFIDHSRPDQRDSAKFPSVFPYWGTRPERFEELFGKHGVVTEWQP